MVYFYLWLTECFTFLFSKLPLIYREELWAYYLSKYIQWVYVSTGDIPFACECEDKNSLEDKKYEKDCDIERH